MREVPIQTKTGTFVHQRKAMLVEDQDQVMEVDQKAEEMSLEKIDLIREVITDSRDKDRRMILQDLERMIIIITESLIMTRIEDITEDFLVKMRMKKITEEEANLLDLKKVNLE